MLFFFDETFRDSCIYKGTSLGALCGIAIPERNLARITTDIYQLKLKHLGADFARDQEIKGKELLKNSGLAIQPADDINDGAKKAVAAVAGQ